VGAKAIPITSTRALLEPASRLRMREAWMRFSESLSATEKETLEVEFERIVYGRGVTLSYSDEEELVCDVGEKTATFKQPRR